MHNPFNLLKFQLPAELESVYPLQLLTFIDIETTGFSAKYHQIINIGLLYYDKQWQFAQYWASTLDEEKKMLLQLAQSDLPDTLYICYNGKTFDIPFILNRLAFHMLPAIPLRHRVVDFISLGRCFSKVNALNSYSFQALEQYFGLNRTDDVAGENVIHAFNAYLATSNPLHKNAILKHNERDVMHMPFILSELTKECGPQLTQIIPIIFKLNHYTLALNQHTEKGQLVLNGDITPEPKLPLEVIAGVEISLLKHKIQIKLPLIELKVSDHVFHRLDWNQCSETKVAYENLTMSEKTKLIFEIDGILQTQTLIDYLRNMLIPWIT